ncbi:thioredoxin domain-containing protein 5 homolog [Anabrus simplex]|uniref:thioredoxin domain-containing protein 5 homolog n=1 Tax=Anabrus simplex TaxID=316456 RepID=UPI0034DD7162
MWRLCALMLVRAVVTIAKEDDVQPVQYTSDTFLTEIAQKNNFVMFYAPWCGHCSRLSPTWTQLAQKFIEDNRDITIAKVDCTIETALCSDQDVTGYPTLKLFKIGESEGVKFRGTRDLPSLIAFVNEQFGNEAEELDSKPKVPEPVNGLVELTDDTFDNHVAKGRHFVKFYAPWCGHCQKLAPTWDALAKSFEHDTSVIISKVDCTLHKTTCNNFDIVGYPTLLWIEDGKKVEKYQGQRTSEELKAFVSRMLGPEHSGASVENVEQDNGSPVASFSGENFEHGIAKGITFVKFFAPWCGHCKRLAPTWEELGKKFIANNAVKIVKVDCTQDISKNLCNEQEVDGFPTLFLYKDGEKVGEYNGSRSLDDLYEFVIKHLPHDEL